MPAGLGSAPWPVHTMSQSFGAPGARVTVTVQYAQPGLYLYRVTHDSGLWVAALLAARAAALQGSSGSRGSTTSPIASTVNNSIEYWGDQVGAYGPTIVGAAIFLAGTGAALSQLR